MTVYGTENRRVASAGGHRLLRRKSIAARVQAIQQAGAAGVALDLRAIHEFLTRVVRTPAGHVVPSSDLCARVKQTRHGATDVWMPDKLACLRLSAKLQGFLDTARLAQTASPASRSCGTQSDQPEPPPPDTPFILTEERWKFLIAQKRAAVERRMQAEEDRLAAEKRAAEEKCRGESPPVLPGPTPSPQAELQRDADGPAIAGGAISRSPRSQVALGTALGSDAPPIPPVRPGPPVGPQPPAWVGPSGRQPYFGQAFRCQAQPETRNQKLEPSPRDAHRGGGGEKWKAGNGRASAMGANPPHPPDAASRVTPEGFSKIVNNHHHPAEPAPPEIRQPDPIPQSEPETRAEAWSRRRGTQRAMGANQSRGPARRPWCNGGKPETFGAPPRQNPPPSAQARDRMSREAALRTRLTGDGCTSDALLVL